MGAKRYRPKIRCGNNSCQKVIARGNLPADVEIKCDDCKGYNDLNGPVVIFTPNKEINGTNSIPYGERKQLLKK